MIILLFIVVTILRFDGFGGYLDNIKGAYRIRSQNRFLMHINYDISKYGSLG